ncbi:hypothetical protein CQ025_14460 [Pseudomonas sp. MYb3]|nr:hypothetical protein CQ025_14460 [Pseudomonas sp. MYb3]
MFLNSETRLSRLPRQPLPDTGGIKNMHLSRRDQWFVNGSREETQPFEERCDLFDQRSRFVITLMPQKP